MTDETETWATGSELLYEALVEAGVDLLVGLPGSQRCPSTGRSPSATRSTT